MGGYDKSQVDIFQGKEAILSAKRSLCGDKKTLMTVLLSMGFPKLERQNPCVETKPNPGPVSVSRLDQAEQGLKQIEKTSHI